MFSVLTQFSGNRQWDTSERNEAYDEKGNILRWKLERSFTRNFLAMSEFISQSYTYASWSSPLTLSFRNLRRASLDRIEAYADKGNFIRVKRERSFLRNFFLIGEFISQTYNLDFRKQFANTFHGICKVIFGSPQGPIVKKKISSHNNYRETLWEIPFWCVASSHRVHTSPLGTVC